MLFLVWHWWMALGQIIAVDVLLSGDNAVVIALACRNLPLRQRNLAVALGAGGAVSARVVFCFTMSALMRIPALKLVGGLLLLWIGVKLLVPERTQGDAGISASSGLWSAIRTIVIADVVMSLDNVVAIVAAASGHLGLVVFGLMLSIPLIVFGSQLVLRVLNRFPIVVTAGGGLLGWLGGGILLHDPLAAKLELGLGPWGERAVALAGAVLVIGIGTVLKRRAAATAGPLEDLTTED
jgi:YjbE family integral membrane protein